MKKFMTMLMALVMVFAMMLPAAAAKSDFVPSAEVKPAPGLVQKPTADGTPAYGEIVMPDGTVIVVPGSAIIITPLGGADTAVPPSIGSELEEAYNEILDAESLKDLIDNLEEILKGIDDEADVDDLVITDLFHIYLDEEYQNYLEEGGTLNLTFEVTDDVILAIINGDSKWNALFGDNFVNNGDGTYTLTVSKSGVVAFLKLASKVDVDPEDPDVSSPTTGDFSMLYIVIGSVLLAVAAGFAVAAKKQKA